MAVASVLTLLIIALSVSLDGFGAGLLYGARGIRIPAGSLLVIAACSGGLLYAAMLLGERLALSLPPKAASAAGAVILMAVGLWSIARFFRSQNAARPAGHAVPMAEQRAPGETAVAARPAHAGMALRPVFRLELKKAGIVVQILRTPAAADAADLDRSGNLSAAEASLLGLALSLDAVGAGVGAALVGYGAETTALCIAAASGLFVFIGTILGRKSARRLGRLAALPGAMLIGAGLLKLFQL